MEEVLFNTIKRPEVGKVNWRYIEEWEKYEPVLKVHKDPSSSSDTGFLHALQCWAPLKSGLPQEEQ